MVRPASKDPSATMGFSLTLSLVQWINEQAIKRGVPKALIVREAVEAMRDKQAESEKEAVAA